MTLDGNGGTYNGQSSVTVQGNYASPSDLRPYTFKKENNMQIGWTGEYSRTNYATPSDLVLYSEPETVTVEFTVGLNESYYPESHHYIKELKARWLQVEDGQIVISSDYGYLDAQGAEQYRVVNAGDILPETIYYNPGTAYELTKSVIAWSATTEAGDDGIYSGTTYLAGEAVPASGAESLLFPIIGYSGGRYAVYHTDEGSFQNGSNILLQRWGSVLGEKYITPPEGKELGGWTKTQGSTTVDIPIGANVYRTLPTGITHLYPVWQAKGTFIKLAAPTELEWGVRWELRGHWDSETEQMVWNSEKSDLPGSVAWKLNEPTQNRYEVKIFRKGENDPVYSATWHLTDTIPYEYFSANHFISEITESGTYYFTVQALGDNTQYKNSDIATSPEWDYAAPDAKLSAPSGLRWDGYEATWSQPSGEHLLGYEMEIYVQDETATYDGGWRTVGRTRTYDANDTAMEIYDRALQSGGAGYYAFRVRALSSDITTILTSDWSEMSLARYISAEKADLSETLTELKNLDTETATEKEVQQAVEAATDAIKTVDTQELKESLLADTDGNGDTQQLIEKVEELAGTAAQPKVTYEIDESASAEEQARQQEQKQQLEEIAGDEKTKIVGAGLNVGTPDIGESTEVSVELQISKPDPDANLVIPEQYKNTVQISLDLVATTTTRDENNQTTTQTTSITGDHRELAVPVKITMPVPTGINPNFLVILHHHADGSVSEVLMPYITYENNKAYATFVLTSFSDFTFAEAKITAQRTATGVDVNIQLPDDASGVPSIYCAVYDKNGKMLGVSKVTALIDGKANVSIACDAANAATVKVFLLGNEDRPVGEALSQSFD